MALTVEDGTGLAAADSYQTVADIDTYNTNHGNASKWRDLTLQQKEEKARLAAQGLDLEFHNQWLGRKRVDGQGLDFPRVEIEDPIDGFIISETSVPKPILDAHAELAIEIALGKTIHSAQSDSAAIKRQRKKLDTLEIETEYSGSKAGTAVADFPRIERLVSRLTTGDTGTVFRG